MATTERILRMEHRKSREGEDEIFVNVEVTTDDDVFTRAEWLTPEEVEEILEEAKHPLKHETNLERKDLVKLNAAKKHVAAVRARAITKRPQQKMEEARAHELEVEKVKALGLKLV